MKKLSILIFIVAAINLQAVTMNELFDALKKQPVSSLDTMGEQLANTALKKVESNYYPKVNLFANHTHYNSATNLLPVDPITASSLISQGDDLPFANTIEKVGIQVSIPLFIKELSSLSKKAEYLGKGAKLKKRLNFLKNQATILGANSGLEYMYYLNQTLQATKKSIEKTKSDIQVSVDSGRSPAIAIDKIDEKLNQIDISINNIKMQQNSLIAKIESLTGIALKNFVSMSLESELQTDTLFALKPLHESINAAQSDLKATKEKRYYPKIAANLMWSENYGWDAVNTDDSVHRGYGYYQIGLSMPLYNQSSDVDIELKTIALMKEKMRLKKTTMELESDAKKLLGELKILEKSQKLTQENISQKQRLLEFAKVATKEGRMSEEDYLRYEDDLLRAKSSYHQMQSQKWQNIAKLAVIYGNDLKGVVR